MPLPRFRIRTLMIAVAILVPLAAVSICRARAARFVRLAIEHQSQVQIGGTPISSVGWKTYKLTDLGLWHVQMSNKYHEAARRPWLPVSPDPPPPN